MNTGFKWMSQYLAAITQGCSPYLNNILRNTTNKCTYKYVDLLYYKQCSLPHVSATYCGHLQGGVLWRIYYIGRQNNLLTYLPTPWSRILLEKLTGLQLVKKFPAFYGIRRFITALTSPRQLSLSSASSIQSTHPHPTSRRSILILSSHLRLGLPSGLLPSGFPTKTLYTPLFNDTPS